MITERTGALIIDMQEGYLKRLSDSVSSGLIRSQKKMIDYMNENDLPVASVVMMPSTRGEFVEPLRTVAQGNAKYVAFLKERANAFTNDSIGEYFKDNSVDQILLMGVYKSQCIRASAFGAIDHRFDFVTSRDLIADPFSSIHRCPDIDAIYRRHGAFVDSNRELL